MNSTVINNFNAYRSGNKLIGVTGEVTLPDFESITTTISGAGILGEIEEAVIGQFGSMKLEVPFRTLNEDIFSLINPMQSTDLTLRGAIQCIEESTGLVFMKGMRVVIRGKVNTFKPGIMKAGEQMNASTTIELLYIMIEIDGSKKVELDKLNSVYIVNNVDLLQKVRSLC